MPGKHPIELSVREGDLIKSERLTRRRFLCMLFGYLAFLALLLHLIGVAALSFHGEVTSWIASMTPPPSLRWVAQSSVYVLWFAYGFALSQLLVNTLLGTLSFD